MSLETNFLSVCRTCLIENSDMQSVFSIQEIMEQSLLLNEMLMSFTSVQVLKDDGLPEQICLNCVQEINRAFLFRKLCEKSDNTLRSCIRTLLPLPVNNDINACIAENEDIETALKTEISVENHEFHLNDEFKLDIDLDDSFHASSFEENDDSNDSYKDKRKLRKKNKLRSKPMKKEYQCKICNNISFGLGDYRRHMVNAHEKVFKCDECDREFISQTMLARHVFSHNLENNENHDTDSPKPKYKSKTGIIKKRNLPRTCTICNKTFRFHSNLERHKLIHTGEKPYLCNVCGKGFAQLSYLKIHSFIHTGEKPYKCKMCEKSFAAPGTLMTHIRTHTGERPHVCKICGKDFPQSGYLSAHIRTHTGEKPIECKVCHRRFNQSGRLVVHMRIHSGEKPYNCMDCGRSFAVKGTLKKHIRTHTGERPYICTVCGQAFAQSGTLATHMKIHKPK